MIDKLIRELTTEKINEKKVIKEYGEGGKFKVYDIYPGAMILIHNLLDSENDLDVNSPDVARLFFLAFTNFEEVDSQLLNKDVFSVLMKKPNKFMREMIDEVLNIGNDALGRYIESIQTYNELPEDQKIELVKFFKENGLGEA